MAITPVIVDTAGTYTGSGLTRMAVPNVGINVGDNTYPAIQQGPFTNGGNRYLVLCNEGDFGVWDGAIGGGPATPCRIRVWKSTDKGLTWAEQDSANAKQSPTYNNTNATTSTRTSGYNTYACAQSGTVIYIARLSWNGVTLSNRVIVISRFDMATNLWLADLTATGDANAPQVPAGGGPINSINYVPLGIFLAIRPSDGHLFVSYGIEVNIGGSWRAVNTPSSPNYTHNRYSEWIPGGGGWQPFVRIFSDDTVAEDFQPTGLVVGVSNLLHFFAVSVIGNAGSDNGPFTTRARHISLTSGGALSVAQTYLPDNAAAGVDENEITIGVPITRPHGVGIVEILIPYLGFRAAPAGTQDLKIARADSAITPAWTLELVSADDSRYSDEFSGRGANAAGYTVDGKVYVWSPGSDVTAIWQFMNAGAGWDAGTAVFTSAVVNGLSSISAYHDPLTEVQGVVFGNGPLASSPYSDDWYFEIGGAGGCPKNAQGA